MRLAVSFVARCDAFSHSMCMERWSRDDDWFGGFAWKRTDEGVERGTGMLMTLGYPPRELGSVSFFWRFEVYFIFMVSAFREAWERWSLLGIFGGEGKKGTWVALQIAEQCFDILETLALVLNSMWFFGSCFCIFLHMFAHCNTHI